MPAPTTHIWLPSGVSVSLEVLRADKAANDYDPNLRFGRNEDNGQWCVFRIVRGEVPLPILGFSDVPGPQELQRRLYQSDALRRGEEILDDMNRFNEDIRRVWEDAAHEGAAIAADAFEWGYRAMGSSRASKIIVPMNGLRGNRMGGYS